MSKVELSEGVRIGNENLVRVTESASQKISTLIDREQKGGFPTHTHNRWGMQRTLLQNEIHTNK